jgi:hypothetical protein
MTRRPAKVGALLRRLHDAETDLAGEYRKIGERHAADHDVYHLAHTFADQCEAHAQRLEPIAELYETELPDEDGPGLWGDVLEAVRRKSSELLGRQPETGVLLLRDLRTLFLAAEECSITWVIAGQAAQAARDQELVDVVTECRTETEIQVKWLTTRIKLAAPQALTA